jgi:hypothetical protein
LRSVATSISTDSANCRVVLDNVADMAHFDNKPAFTCPVDLAEIDRAVHYRLPPLSSDVEPGIRGGGLAPCRFGLAGSQWWEPWPCED